MVDVLAYDSSKAFLQDNLGRLEQHEAENSLLLGHALLSQSDPVGRTVRSYWTVALNGAGCDLLASVAPPQPLVLAAAGPEAAPAARHLARALRAGGWQITGVIGLDVAATKFAEDWGQLTGETWRVRRQLRVYELRGAADHPLARGRLRAATAEDLARVTAWTEAFEKEALGASQRRDAEDLARRRVAAGEIAIWDDGGPVAMAGQARPTSHGITINAVYTPPEFRRRGYASACVAALTQQMLDEGRDFCTLSADVANPTANRIYQSIGYRAVCDFNDIAFTA